MSNQYKEVLMTYLRRPFSSRRAVLFLAIGFYLLLSDSGGRSGHLDPEMAFAGVTILGGLLWFQFREHVANHRRKLTPGYAYAQFGVFAGLSIVLLSAAGLCLVLIGNSSVTASLALTVAIFGMIGIYVACPSYTILLICLLLVLGSEFYANKMTVLLSDQSTLTAAMVIACGLIGIIWSMVRLLNFTEEQYGFTEEQYGYRGPLELSLFRQKSKDKSINGLPAIATAQSSVLPKAAIALAAAKPQPQSLVRYPRRKWPRVYGLWFSHLLLVLLFLTIILFLTGALHHRKTVDVLLNAQFGLPGLLVFPGQFVALRWLSLWPYLATESLRPVTRGQFVRRIGVILFKQWILAFIMAAAFFIMLIYLTGDGLVGALVFTPLISAVLLAQPLVFLLFWWALQYRSPIGLVAIAIVPLAISAPVFPTVHFARVIVMGIALMILGLILLPFVYRRWMNLEMG